ncbi:MAG: aminotransferase class IV [Acidobacteria bacterium]|nr:aminotransferase class IV [Acidobacteriota bacterium]
MHRYILHNDQILDAAERCLSPGQVGLLSGWGVFSTIRVAHGVLFEFARHYARMHRDAALMRVPLPPADWMETRLLKLVEANDARDATLRVVAVRNRGGIWEGPGSERDSDVIALTTKLTDWGAGVRLGLVRDARHAASRFAGTKVLSWAANLTLYEEAHHSGFDEVVLLNERGEVSECTSANIFVVEGSQIWTPPLSSGCLPGVTRELLLGEVRVNGIKSGEQTLFPEDLERADAVFITSTTRALLPIISIEGLNIRHDDRVRGLLLDEFRRYLDDYVAAHAGG